MNGAVRVRDANAETAKNALLGGGVFDRHHKPVAREGFVVFRVTDVERALAIVPDAEAVPPPDQLPHVPLEAREPRVRVVRALEAAGWSAEALTEVPHKWEKLGDVIVLRVPDALRSREAALARAFADALRAKTVLVDEGGVSGELRMMARTRFLLGDDAVTTHVENGVRYRLDASRIMFSSGNVGERKRAASFPAEGETVVDMFAGVGYFALPIAVHARPARVVALEKNPLAHRYLVENVTLNRVEEVVEPWLGDNRDHPEEGFADRVHMGYVGTTHEFLDKALRILKPSGGTIHYHDTAGADAWRAELEAHVTEAAARAGRSFEVVAGRVVKSYSPGVVHAVLDVTVR